MISVETDSSITAQSAFSILREDLHRVDRLFRGYASLASVSSSRADRNGLIARFGAYLQATSRIEAELVYPQLEGVVDDEALRSARQDHARIEAQLRSVVDPVDKDGSSVDQRVQELARTTRAHLALAEERLFAPGAAVDTPALAARVAVRRAQLLGEQGPD